MSLIINLIPVIVVLILLFTKKHMLVAGLSGAVVAVLIGGLSIEMISNLFIDGVGNMMAITVPILYAATADMVSKGGSIQALVKLAKRLLKSKTAILAGIIVLIQGFATYAAGTAAGNTMVTGPLIAMAVGAVPEVIAGMAIVSAVGFTTAPSSTETALTAESAGTEVVTQAGNMLPFTIVFYLLGVALAIYGVYKKGTLVSNSDTPEEREETEESNKELLTRSIPFISLLVMVVFGNSLNTLIGISLFTPPVIVIFTTIITIFFTPLDMNETSEALVDGSKFILTTLFSVGIFLGFINMIAELGTFEQLAALTELVPESIVLPVTMVLAFLIAIPSGAFAAGVLALILPTLATLGLPSEAMGFVAIAVGLGTQISPVQINVAALSGGFDLDLLDVVKYNSKYIIGTLVVAMIIAVIFI